MPHSQDYIIFRRAFTLAISFTLLLWLVLAIERLGNFDFTPYGIYPRTLAGSIGILTAPLIHGGVYHLLSNTLPLLILGIGLFYLYHRIALEVFIWIYLVTGSWVWVIGRHAYHIGASGIIYGFMSFLFVSGLIRRNIRSLAISMAVFVLYGGMIYGIMPVEPDISWESHLMGLLAGTMVALFFRKEPIFVGEARHEESSDDDEPEEGQSYYSRMTHTSEKDIHITYDYQPRTPEQGNKQNPGTKN